ncbi:hypothetical protein I4I73_21785 [Pseudonocardia sp. KRD-184]|uniref:Uncharacterized protein n=1 Tax=Pseudonocardia oceani TaxID=2792013 RepID=A0ABS6UJP4_9PSEU|nr:hypothetical protein [Pseudonocardia oceani]MBW0092832.1 hypothetical protein [Pseudonocardia oceani]MBW0098624.1 hypothetical protein [Pseudonocardia oceani]MBW0111137.1 hypothetical protein [Pseudonocardia oceani]MBW0123742.1 hypothetical protein [Pseudonocardia oceani]MBW0132146.1 hypothetical protein [Pseudonocardia oceani]
MTSLLLVDHARGLPPVVGPAPGKAMIDQVTGARQEIHCVIGERFARMDHAYG